MFLKGLELQIGLKNQPTWEKCIVIRFFVNSSDSQGENQDPGTGTDRDNAQKRCPAISLYIVIFQWFMKLRKTHTCSGDTSLLRKFF